MKSTCSIVLTTDMCPMSLLQNKNNNNNKKEEGEEGGSCTTHTYTFSPDQVYFRFIIITRFTSNN